MGNLLHAQPWVVRVTSQLRDTQIQRDRLSACQTTRSERWVNASHLLTCDMLWWWSLAKSKMSSVCWSMADRPRKHTHNTDTHTQVLIEWKWHYTGTALWTSVIFPQDPPSFGLVQQKQKLSDYTGRPKTEASQETHAFNSRWGSGEC